MAAITPAGPQGPAFLENTMSDDTKALLGAVIAAPILYFLLVVVMSF